MLSGRALTSRAASGRSSPAPALRWLLLRDRHELVQVGAAWRAALPVGVLSLCGSAGWAVAVTMTNAAKVRTLGQVELVIAFAISAWVLHERHTRAEYAASALVMVGVIGVVALG